MTAYTCSDCGASTENVFGLCSPCAKAVVALTRVARGSPPTVEDPGVLDRIAAAFRS